MIKDLKSLRHKKEEKEELLFSVGYSIDICRSYIKFLFYLLVFFLFLGYCFGRLNA